MYLLSDTKESLWQKEKLQKARKNDTFSSEVIISIHALLCTSIFNGCCCCDLTQLLTPEEIGDK